jgi:hypothetical protein
MSSNSKLRNQDVMNSTQPALSDETALFLIRDSVAKRRALIYGRLHGENEGEHCALGAFWADNPKATLNTTLIDEVAAVNDSVPRTATPHQRWKKVNEWLRFKIGVMMAGKKR